MKQNEYVTTLVVGDYLIPVGIDDAGQTYFFEYVEDGELKEECCGSFNSNYKSYIEYRFGDPEKDCPYYESQFITEPQCDCEHRFEFGYCDKCKFQDIDWTHYQRLIELGVIDRRGNVLEPYTKYITRREERDECKD